MVKYDSDNLTPAQQAVVDGHGPYMFWIKSGGEMIPVVTVQAANRLQTRTIEHFTQPPQAVMT